MSQKKKWSASKKFEIALYNDPHTLDHEIQIMHVLKAYEMGIPAVDLARSMTSAKTH